LFTLFVFAFSFVACDDNTTELTTEGTTTEEVTTYNDPNTLVVQFVPSTTIDTAKLTLLQGLEVMLEDSLAAQGYDINVNIGVGTSYASVIEAMVSGQVHVGFLTSQQYAFTTLMFPDEVEVLLTSVRNAYEIQIDNDGNEITDKAALITAANTEGYNAATTSEHKVSSYYSMLLVRTEDYEDYDTEGIAGLAGKNVAVQSVTSGSGYIYPSFLLYQNEMSFVTDEPNAAEGEVKATTISGHTTAVNALLNGDVDAVFTYFDARYNTNDFAAWQDAHPELNIFTYTRVVDLTPPIYNDTISALQSLSPGLREAIQQAFIDIIATTEGATALAIYNHTGYLRAIDSDYDSERELYMFLHQE